MIFVLCLFLTASSAFAQYGDAPYGTVVYGDVSSSGFQYDFSEAISFFDLKSLSPRKTSASGISLSDATLKGTGKGFSATVNLSDAVAKSVGKPGLADSVSLVDQSLKTNGKSLNSSMTFTDSTVNAVNKNLSSTSVFIDSLTVQLALLKSEALSLMDVCNRVINPGQYSWQQNLNDGVTFADAKGISVIKPLSASISFVDLYSRSLGKLIANAIGFIDSFGRTVGYNKSFSETMVFSDSRSTQYEVFIGSTISLTDLTGFNLPNQNWAIGLSDGLILSDGIRRNVAKGMDDSTSFSETFVRGTFKRLSDNLTMLDLLSRSVMYYKVLDDTMRLIDNNSLAPSIKHTINIYFDLKTAIVNFLFRTPSVDFHLMGVQ